MSLTVTEAAIKELKSVKEDQNFEDYYVRVQIAAGGCSGFQYSMNFVESKDYNETDDKLIEQDGLGIIVDKKSMLYLDGTTLDWYEDLNKRGFAFDNPNAVKNCGCGQSFQV